MVALRDLDLEIRGGEALGLIGHNGAGKTTLLRILAGILKPTSGRATILACAPGSLGARRRSAHVPDDPGFPAPWLSAADMIRCAARLDGSEKSWNGRRIDELLDRVGIEERRRPVKAFSRGTRRKLALALALMSDPEVLVLDEPTGDLDPEARIRFRETVRELKEGGTAVLFSSHVLAELETVCDRAAFLRKGRLLAVHDLRAGRPEAPVRILHRPRVSDLAGGLGDHAEVGERGWTETIVPAAEREERMQALLSSGATIARVETMDEGLEGLFLKYMTESSTAPDDAR